MKHILLVEDDQKLSLQLTHSLLEAGFAVDAVLTPEALASAIGGGARFDLVVLDRLVGCLDTKVEIPRIKARWPDSPILIVSAINTPAERAELINLGADDYIGKPFFTDELIARIRSFLRRVPEKKSDIRRIGKAQFDLTHRRISVGALFEDLPSKEFMILNALSDMPGKVIGRAELLESVWGSKNHAETNLVEATVTNLRRRLSAIDCGFKIRNQRNTGYWIEG